MVFHMKAKTTLTIDDQVMRRIKERAAREGTTMSDLVETALRRLLDEPPKPRQRITIRQFDIGPYPVDVSNRDALEEFLDEGN